MSEVRRFEMETDYSIRMTERVAELEAELERYKKALDYASNDLDPEDRVVIWQIVKGEDTHELRTTT